MRTLLSPLIQMILFERVSCTQKDRFRAMERLKGSLAAQPSDGVKMIINIAHFALGDRL